MLWRECASDEGNLPTAIEAIACLTHKTAIDIQLEGRALRDYLERVGLAYFNSGVAGWLKQVDIIGAIASVMPAEEVGALDADLKIVKLLALDAQQDAGIIATQQGTLDLERAITKAGVAQRAWLQIVRLLHQHVVATICENAASCTLAPIAAIIAAQRCVEQWRGAGNRGEGRGRGCGAYIQATGL